MSTNGKLSLNLAYNPRHAESYEKFMERFGKSLALEFMTLFYEMTKENKSAIAYHLDFRFYAIDMNGNTIDSLPSCEECGQFKED